MVKPEPGSRAAAPETAADDDGQGVAQRRVLRSQYLAVKNRITDEGDDIARLGSDKFRNIITQVESLHNQVQKPREQVADAETLLGLANTLVQTVKSYGNGGLSPTDFITALLKNFSQQYRGISTDENAPVVVKWECIGLAVSHVFKSAPGCRTMIGPMNTEMKQRKPVVHRKRTLPTERARPEELNAQEEHKTDTDKNMSVMFDILGKMRTVRLDQLVLSRNSFAQTVENIFALSFLVKDGRAEIAIDGTGHHIVSPKNAPSANDIASGKVSHSHFVFRFDFKDWKVMKDQVEVGEELMPDRSQTSTSGANQAEPTNVVPPSPIHTTPIRKLSRNRGLIIQNQAVDDTPEQDQKGKRRLFD